MSILRNVFGNEVSKIIGHVGKKYVPTNIVEPILGKTTNRALELASKPEQNERNVNNPDPNIQLVYDYFKYIKSDSLTAYYPHLTKMGLLKELGKNILHRETGINPDIVRVYDDENGNHVLPIFDHLPKVKVPPKVNEFLRYTNDILDDPVKGLMNVYDHLRQRSKRKTTEQVEEVVGKTVPIKLPDNPLHSREPIIPSYHIPKPEVPDPELEYESGFPHFKGYKSVEGIEVWSSHLWDIKMEPYIHNGVGLAPNPPTHNNFLPATSFELSDDMISPFNVELYGGSSFVIPESRQFARSIRIGVIDVFKNRKRVWKKYMADYKKAMVNDYLVTPYKNVCTKITIYILDTNTMVMKKNIYLGILTNPDTSAQGSNAGVEEFQLEFSIVGELTESMESLWE